MASAPLTSGHELDDVEFSKTPRWPSYGSCTADDVLAWPIFGSDAFTFMENHRQVLQSTLAPQGLQHKLNIFGDEKGPLIKEWQIHSKLRSRIYRFVDFAAKTLGLDTGWAFRAGACSALLVSIEAAPPVVRCCGSPTSCKKALKVACCSGEPQRSLHVGAVLWSPWP